MILPNDSICLQTDMCRWFNAKYACYLFLFFFGEEFTFSKIPKSDICADCDFMHTFVCMQIYWRSFYITRCCKKFKTFFDVSSFVPHLETVTEKDDTQMNHTHTFVCSNVCGGAENVHTWKRHGQSKILQRYICV